MKKIFILFATLLVSQVVIAGNVFCSDSQIQWISDSGRTRRTASPVYNPVGKLDPFQPIFSNDPTKLAPTVHQNRTPTNRACSGS